MQRRRIPKFESSVGPSRQKDNSTYISVFPLERSQLFLNHNTQQLRSNKIQFQNQQLVDHFQKLIKQQNAQKIEKHEVDRYFSSVVTRPAAKAGSPVTSSFLDNYNLSSEDLVPVCENKYFSLKSYYNYLHDEQVQKAYTKIQQRNQNLQFQLNRQKQRQLQQQQQMINSQYMSKLGRSKQEEQVMDPIHVKFQERQRGGISFNLKERERLEISKRGNLRDSNQRWF